MMNSVVAAQLYTLRDFTKTEKDIRETFARVNDLGFEAVQISALAKIDANVLRDIADKNQLKIIASHISYDLILNDNNGKLSINWGAYGVPETFIVFNNKIVKKYTGPLNEINVQEIRKILSKWKKF